MSLYYACEYVVDLQTARCLVDAFVAIRELGGKLDILKSGLRDQEGYIYEVYCIEVPEETSLGKFQEEIGNAMGLNNWRRISSEECEASEEKLAHEEAWVVENYVYGRYMRGYGTMNQSHKGHAEI